MMWYDEKYDTQLLFVLKNTLERTPGITYNAITKASYTPSRQNFETLNASARIAGENVETVLLSPPRRGYRECGHGKG